MARLFPLRTLLIAGAVVALVIGLLAFNGQCSATRKAEGEAKVANSQAGLGVEALQRTDELAVANAAAEEVTKANTDFVNGADNANQDAGEAGNRGRYLYCERQRMRGKLEPNYCLELRRVYRP